MQTLSYDTKGHEYITIKGLTKYPSKKSTMYIYSGGHQDILSIIIGLDKVPLGRIIDLSTSINGAFEIKGITKKIVVNGSYRLYANPIQPEIYFVDNNTSSK